MCREHFMDQARRKAKKEARQAMAQDTERTARAAVDFSRKAAADIAKAAKSLTGALSASGFFNGFKTDSSIIRLPLNKENFFNQARPKRPTVSFY